LGGFSVVTRIEVDVEEKPIESQEPSLLRLITPSGLALMFICALLAVLQELVVSFWLSLIVGALVGIPVSRFRFAMWADYLKQLARAKKNRIRNALLVFVVSYVAVLVGRTSDIQISAAVLGFCVGILIANMLWTVRLRQKAQQS
jgi:Kef-type K+ transport system membrane component KefB